MPGKWGGACRACPPRSANELGCQANGGARAGRAPLDPPMIYILDSCDRFSDENTQQCGCLPIAIDGNMTPYYSFFWFFVERT